MLSSTEESEGLKEDRFIPGQLHCRVCLQRDNHPGCDCSTKSVAGLAGEPGYCLT